MSDELITYLTYEKDYQAILRGKKNLSFKKVNEEIKIGDTLEFMEIKKETKQITGNIMRVKVTRILHGERYGIPANYMIVYFEPLF